MNVPNLKLDFADPSSPVQMSIEQVLGAMLPKEEAEVVTIFMIHGSPMTNDMSNWEPRLAAALRTYKADEPLVLVGLIRPDQAKLGESPTFQALTARPRVRYVDIIGNFLPGVIQAIDAVRKAPATPLLPVQQVRELRLGISKTELSYIRHDLKYAPPGSEKERQLLERARKAGLVGDDQSLRQALEAAGDIPAALVCRGQRFAGIFCDAEGTLLNQNDTVNDRVLSILKDAEAQGRSVTVWTGGDPVTVAAKLRQVGLTYEIARKSDFAGATVEEVIDDNLNELRSQYTITAERERDPRTLAP